MKFYMDVTEWISACTRQRNFCVVLLYWKTAFYERLYDGYNVCHAENCSQLVLEYGDTLIVRFLQHFAVKLNKNRIHFISICLYSLF